MRIVKGIDFQYKIFFSRSNFSLLFYYVGFGDILWKIAILLKQFYGKSKMLWNTWVFWWSCRHCKSYSSMFGIPETSETNWVIGSSEIHWYSSSERVMIGADCGYRLKSSSSSYCNLMYEKESCERDCRIFGSNTVSAFWQLLLRRNMIQTSLIVFLWFSMRAIFSCVVSAEQSIVTSSGSCAVPVRIVSFFCVQ